VITELEFKSLASEGYNRIPLVSEAFADLETPLSLYLKLAHAQGDGKHSFLLESVVGGERFGRYSFIGLPARTFLRSSGFGAAAQTEVVTDGAVVETHAGNPLDFIAAYQQRFRVALVPGLPRFAAVWPATSAMTPCATSRRSWSSPARPTRWAHPTSCCCCAKRLR